MNYLAVLQLGCLLVSTTLGCSKLEASGDRGAAVQQPRQYVVLIDLSASRSPEVLKEDQQFVGQLVQNLNYGDRFVVLQMQQVGLAERPHHWETDMPVPADATFLTSHDKQKLVGAQKGLLYLLPSFFLNKNEAKVIHTDIFTTLQIASELTHDSNHKKPVLVLLSDLLQSAKGIEMDHLAHMPPQGWIAIQQRLDLLPHLADACVSVLGADPTTKEGVTVRKFWQSYFTAAGASLDSNQYRTTPPTSGAIPCA
jgi:hypothetical protein